VIREEWPIREKYNRMRTGQIMTPDKTDLNKRRYIRYEVDLGSFAVFRGDPMVLPGLIVDISKGGLAFFYHEEGGWPDDGAERCHLFGDQYNVENVPLISSYDVEVTDTEHPVYQLLAGQKDDSVKIRRRGVRFGDLSSEQEAVIEDIVTAFHAVSC
jgi:hypothetical protein